MIQTKQTKIDTNCESHLTQFYSQTIQTVPSIHVLIAEWCVKERIQDANMQCQGNPWTGFAGGKDQTSYLSFFLHIENFLDKFFSTQKCVNWDKTHFATKCVNSPHLSCGDIGNLAICGELLEIYT